MMEGHGVAPACGQNGRFWELIESISIHCVGSVWNSENGENRGPKSTIMTLILLDGIDYDLSMEEDGKR